MTLTCQICERTSTKCICQTQESKPMVLHNVKTAIVNYQKTKNSGIFVTDSTNVYKYYKRLPTAVAEVMQNSIKQCMENDTLTFTTSFWKIYKGYYIDVYKPVEGYKSLMLFWREDMKQFVPWESKHIAHKHFISATHEAITWAAEDEIPCFLQQSTY